jgi:GNAT superfamily N-acetyltransferase
MTEGRIFNYGDAMNLASIDVRQVEQLGDGILPLMIEAEAEGYRFMQRLHDEWHSGANRFQGPGEFLLSVQTENRLVAIGGLNVDPYANAHTVGRLRHLYVAAAARRSGIGAMLVRRIVEGASGTFSILRLRTATAEGAAFYERLGFHKTSEPDATHVLKF